MAKFTSGIGFGQASGSVAGSTYSRNRFGPYIRNRAMPVNPHTSFQTQIRQMLTARAQAWRSLTANERTAWNAEALNYFLSDSLGQQYNPTGFGLYQSVNITRQILGLALVTNPPPIDAAPQITSAGGTAVGATGVISVTFDPVPPANTHYIVQMTRPVSPGVLFFGRSDFRNVAVLDSTDTSPQIITTTWQAFFGNITTADVGQRIGIRLIPVSPNGYRGTAIQASMLIT